jgi:hypothetical protein
VRGRACAGERGGRPGDGARQAGLSDGARQARGRRRGGGDKKDGGFGREKRKDVFTNSSVRHLNRSGGSKSIHMEAAVDIQPTGCARWTN